MFHYFSKNLYIAKLHLVAAVLAIASVTVQARAQSVNATVVAAPALTAAQIVEAMQLHNKARADALRHYQSLRHYEVEYKGYATKIGAKMVVEANYDAISGKSFRIVSQSGSNLLVDKVLKKLLEGEKDAGQDKRSTALTPENYSFRLTGIETLLNRPAYILEVEPIVASKYLYRGRIWIDTADFAVVRIDASPAKNPSFWISSTAINHHYAKTGDFWLPAQNRSETKVRIGGTAVLTIDYGTYEVNPEVVAAGGGI